MIKILNSSGNAAIHAGRMLNGSYLTTDERKMWTAAMPDFKKSLEILISLPFNVTPGALRIWNYNRSTLDSVKGLKEIEIELNGKTVYQGLVNRGAGNAFTDYSTLIPFVQGIKIPPPALLAQSLKV